MTGSVTYKDAGVDIAGGDEFVENIKQHVKSTHRAGWLDAIGGFGGLFEIPIERFKRPVLVSGTDGVGTKLKIAQLVNRHDSIGVDLVAMCVNDILCQGGEPLYFLDYFACGKLNPAIAEQVVKGIAQACKQSSMALIGGETAEMPGIYQDEDYDLAGFCVGIVEKDKIITGNAIKAGDSIIAIASSGLHSNGYSLVRKILEITNPDLNEKIGSSSLSEHLIRPTRIYVKSILSLLAKINVSGIAHITGGGIKGNLVRILPEKLKAQVDLLSWQLPEIFKWLQAKGNIVDEELFKTFNCGVGMMLIVNGKDTAKTISILNECGEQAWIAGEILPTTHSPIVEFDA